MPIFWCISTAFSFNAKNSQLHSSITEKKKLREENSGHLIEPCILTDV